MPERKSYNTYPLVAIVEIDGKEYVGKPMTVDVAETIYTQPNATPRKILRSQVAATFGLDESVIGAMHYGVYNKLVELMGEVNGLTKAEGEKNPVDAVEGETQAAASISA